MTTPDVSATCQQVSAAFPQHIDALHDAIFAAPGVPMMETGLVLLQMAHEALMRVAQTSTSASLTDILGQIGHAIAFAEDLVKVLHRMPDADPYDVGFVEANLAYMQQTVQTYRDQVASA